MEEINATPAKKNKEFKRKREEELRRLQKSGN